MSPTASRLDPHPTDFAALIGRPPPFRGRYLPAAFANANIVKSLQRGSGRGAACARGQRRCGYGAADKAAAENARLPLGRVIENAGLAGRHALLALNEVDLNAGCAAAEPCGLRRPGRAHLHEHFVPAGTKRAIDAALAKPVDLAQPYAAGAQRLTRSHHHAPRGSVEP